jgi:hypothetical protein
MVRKSAEERLDNIVDARYDEFGIPLSRSSRSYMIHQQQQRRSGHGNELVGSRSSAQRLIHSFALVCKRWQQVSREVGFSEIHLRHLRNAHQMPCVLAQPNALWMYALTRRIDRKLISLLTSDTHSSLVEHIVTINAKLPMSAPPPSVVGTMRGSRNAWRHTGNYASAGWSALSTSNDGSSSGIASDNEDSPATQFCRLVTLSKNLQSLSLTILGTTYSVRFRLCLPICIPALTKGSGRDRLSDVDIRVTTSSRIS